MSGTTLPETIHLPPDHTRHNLSIAAIVIYGVFLPLVWLIEYAVAWSDWVSKKRERLDWRVPLFIFFDFLSLLCIIRIIGSALYLSTSSPSTGVFIVQTLFSSLGYMPMVMKLLLILQRIIRKAPDQSSLVLVGRALILVRVILSVGVILIIAGASTLILALWKAGSMVVVVAFLLLGSIHICLLLPTRWHNALPKGGNRGLAVAATALPPLLVRAVYFIVLEFSEDGKYHPVTGDPGYLVGLGYTMELLVIISLLSATIVSEELPWFNQRVDYGKITRQKSSDGPDNHA
ncbi:uncharacterized protein DNG_10132 [Cephalotrichum gorgonifer]|uniref:DUF7702 domain-containing protein n=1 Tax=Cephalotrichum gorgonifer TaxID=2041049 RepID=A0AAE8T014_9PEZI|nr:uncharacterized protein DNG_10132 [Cephalotrichum gorgonifer]